MSVENLSKRPGPGRPRLTAIDRFQAMAWFNTISSWEGDDSPFRLEKIFQPENVKINLEGKQIASRAWDKYRHGTRLPRDGYMSDGRPGAVLAAARRVPDSVFIYRHPIWKVMRVNRLSFERVVEILHLFPPFVRRYYIDLEVTGYERQCESFEESIGKPIWVDQQDELSVSLDHLVIHLMILKLDNFRHNRERFECISENIANTLGPLSASPWFEKIYEELYDWLEKYVWKGIFDQYYPYGSQSIPGWRRSQTRWIYQSFSYRRP
jgi:hypothetical protein